MARRILSISTDRSLLVTRHLLLKQAGHDVVSAIGWRAGLIHCSAVKFDLIIFGHGIPRSDKASMLRAIRDVCSTPVLSLYRRDEGPLPGVDYVLDGSAEPTALLQLVDSIFRRVASLSHAQTHP